MNQTSNGATVLNDTSTSTEDWRALSTGDVSANVSRRAQNNATSTESALQTKFGNWPFPLPAWLVNGSFGQLNTLEEFIEKYKDDMVPVPGKQNT